MANPQTAADWQTAANNIQDELRLNLIEENSLKSTKANLESQRASLAQQRDQYPFGTSTWLFYQNQVLEVGAKIVQIDNTIGTILGENQILNQEYNNALAQKALAEQGQPGANENTPPASEEPGNNVQVENPDIVVGNTQEAVDEFAGVEEAVAIEADTLNEPPELNDDEVDQILNQTTNADLVPYEAPELIDEFEGVDAAAAAQENALPEPPELSDDEVDQILNQPTNEDLEGLDEPPFVEDNDPQNQAFLDANAEPESGEGLEFPPITEEPTSGDSADDDNEEEPEEPVASTGTEPPATRGLQGRIARVRQQATAQGLYNYQANKDWRVRLQLAESANYLYRASPAGILAPLKKTDGIIFPYTPKISVSYAASYSSSDVAHSNYKIYNYTNSSVDQISLTCDFTAQDTYEGNYVLAVIHFFRSVTKMFYGKDIDPENGTPPPLCYLTGLGAYQFNRHPIAITNFTYSLPDDVDYIRCTSDAEFDIDNEDTNETLGRAETSGLGPGGSPLPTKFNGKSLDNGAEFTYIPTKIQIQVSAIPILSRADVSNTFSLEQYATGKLLINRPGKGGGFW